MPSHKSETASLEKCVKIEDKQITNTFKHFGDFFFLFLFLTFSFARRFYFFVDFYCHKFIISLLCTIVTWISNFDSATNFKSENVRLFFLFFCSFVCVSLIWMILPGLNKDETIQSHLWWDFCFLTLTCKIISLNSCIEFWLM